MPRLALAPLHAAGTLKEADVYATDGLAFAAAFGRGVAAGAPPPTPPAAVYRALPTNILTFADDAARPPVAAFLAAHAYAVTASFWHTPGVRAEVYTHACWAALAAAAAAATPPS